MIRVILLLVAVGGVWTLDTINTDLVITNADRSIDVTSQLAKTSYKITIENTGKTPAKSVLFVLEHSLRDHVSFLNAHSTDGKIALKVMVTRVQGHDDKLFWRIDLRDNLQPGKSIGIEVETVLSNFLTPHPAQISQKEKQLILYSGNAYIYSPYKINKQTTTFVLGTKYIENFTKVKPVSQADSSIVYGPYNNLGSFSVEKISVHYENNSPFLVITDVERVLEVSHWGNIAIEETISLLHKGATLKGSFSRYDYQRETQSGLSSVKSFKTILPAAAMDAYYRDEIGNISTSHMRTLSDSVELDLRPRFPLFGGWKTKYTIGYNVPSYEYLYNAGDEFLLKMRVVDHVFDDMNVEDLITKIILPEGSKDIRLRTPYPVQRLADEWHSTYLDTVGRRVIVIKKKNLVENHIQDFELSYTFPRILMLQEPLLAVSGFYILFLLVIIYVRLDFSISKGESKKDD